MKQFIAFVHKEFYHIFRDIRTMMILLGMPIIEIIIFGFALSTDIKDIRVSILNPNEDIVSRKIIERIDASEYFIVDRYLHTSNEIEKEFKEGKADMVIVFSEQFSSKLLHTGEAGIQIIADATDPNTAKTFTQYAASIIAASQQELTLGNNIPMHITSSIKLLYNPQMKSAYNFVPGVMGLILMLICAMMTSISIVREKEMGTMEVLLVSPMRPIFIILAKAVPYFVLSCVNLFTILILSVYVLHVPIAGSLFWLIIVSLLFIFVSLSLGLLISTLTKTQVAAMLASGMILMMPTMLLSGMIFPIESMPPILQWISHIIPAKWYIMTVKKLMIEGVNVSLAWQEISILMFMSIILITISLKKFKNRLEYYENKIPHRKRVQTDDQGLIHAEINIDLSVHDDDIDALGGRP